ncbi:hypothetical protein GCM10009715_21320 [Paeniglutamicibacter psychrophenolicus]|uniref:Tetratricopeptide repeat protein n=1 Tax=Paeniglutamicibacter psychrophenolicus TaxID=257454 RepID=A0ABS4WH92_9MICC|nr:tetratricopeptide repeat protein [Paeniglutamicibacter psychrophenolicus]MBP2375568.1 hypothetical protein [Paeniglutamicibacter psychrophenolicus]
MKTKFWVGAILLLFVFYLVAAFGSALRFITAEEPIAKVIGVAALVIPLVGVWILIREVLFGSRTQKMASILASEGLLPEDNLPRTPSGRIVKAAADEDFVQYKEEVEANPESWKSWHRLALAYDAAGDRRRARESMRKAIGLYLAAGKQ